MRILYLTHQYFPRSIGGTEVYLRGLVRRAVAAGHEPEVLTYVESPAANYNAFGLRHSTYENVPLAEVHFNLSTASEPARAEYDNPLIGKLVRSEIERFRPDIVHVMHAMKLSAAALDAAVDAGKAVIVTLCDFWFLCMRHTLLKPDGALCRGPRHSLDCVRCARATHGFANGPWNDSPEVIEWMKAAWRLSWSGHSDRYLNDVRAIRERTTVLRKKLLRANRIIALSDFMRKILVTNGYPAHRIEVLRHGFESDGIARAEPWTGGTPRVVFIGSLVPHKGPHLLGEALAQIPGVQLECLIYGAGPEGPYLRRLQRFATHDPRFKLMGTFPPEEIGAVLGNATVFALPAQWFENEPLVVKSALHAGVPVIASRLGSLTELVRDEHEGWLLPSADVPAWANALRRVALAPGDLPRPKTPQKTMDENAAEIFEIYRQMLSA